MSGNHKEFICQGMDNLGVEVEKIISTDTEENAKNRMKQLGYFVTRIKVKPKTEAELDKDLDQLRQLRDKIDIQEARTFYFSVGFFAGLCIGLIAGLIIGMLLS